MSDDLPYKVGKNKPPVEHRFKKGEPSPNRGGRRKAGAVDLVAFFEQPVTVAVNGEAKKVHPFEAALTNIAQRAIEKKDMRAAKRFLGYCADAGLIVDPRRQGDGPASYRVSSAWDYEEWLECYKRYGSPPWPGPRNGLFNDDWREEVLRSEGLL